MEMTLTGIRSPNSPQPREATLKPNTELRNYFSQEKQITDALNIPSQNSGDSALKFTVTQTVLVAVPIQQQLPQSPMWSQLQYQ